MLTTEPASTKRQPFTTGPDQGVIEEARRRQRKRRMRGAAVALVAAAAVAGIAWGIGGGGSNAARGHGSPIDRTTTTHAPGAQGRAFNLRLTPALRGGDVGWDVVMEGGPDGTMGGSGGTPTPSTPLFGGVFSVNARNGSEDIVTLATPQVAAVLVDGRIRVLTVALPGLPYGLRAVRVQGPARFSPPKPSPSGSPPVPPGPPGPQLKLVALDAHGNRIPERLRPSGQAEGVFWQHPSPPPQGACQLSFSGLPSLSPQWGHVVQTIHALHGRIVGRAFLSCIDTEYYLQNWGLDAAVLLDVEHPGRLPAAIPGLKSIPGAPRFYNGPGEAFSRGLTATRYGPSWLVVEGGSGAAQRIDVLRHLTAIVKL